MQKSIMQDDDWCYICRKIGFPNFGTDTHHCIHGTANRKLADEDGLTVKLCRKHHMALHDKGIYDRELQKEAQEKWMEHYGKSLEEWIRRYGKSFL